MTKWFLIIVFLIFSSWSYLFASNEVGNGTDHDVESQKAAWFVQFAKEIRKTGTEKQVHYCYEISPEFGLNSEKVEASLKTAFEVWRRYLIQKKVNDMFPVAILTQGKLQDECNGREDLKFYFGVSNSEIEEQKRKYVNPTAFVHRRQYDVQKGWSQGFVWIAPMATVAPEKKFPNWQEDGLLNAFLLHELGHIFGCGHIEGTIMDSRLSSLLEKGKYPKSNWNRIDYSRQLVILPREIAAYPGTLGALNAQQFSEEWFVRLMGRRPVGAFQSDYFSDPFGSSLRIRDEKSIGNFGLSDEALQRPIQINQDAAFRFYAIDEGGRLYRGQRESVAYLKVGTIRSYTGDKIEVVLEYNAEQSLSELFEQPVLGPVNIKFNHNGRMVPLFSSFPL